MWNRPTLSFHSEAKCVFGVFAKSSDVVILHSQDDDGSGRTLDRARESDLPRATTGMYYTTSVTRGHPNSWRSAPFTARHQGDPYWGAALSYAVESWVSRLTLPPVSQPDWRRRNCTSFARRRCWPAPGAVQLRRSPGNGHHILTTDPSLR